MRTLTGGGGLRNLRVAGGSGASRASPKRRVSLDFSNLWEYYMDMNAMAINCTMERSTADEATETFTLVEVDRLSEDGVETEMIWAIDHNMLPGMNSFEDEGVEWDALRRPFLDSRVFVIGRPN